MRSKLKYKDIELDIYDGYNISKSSQDITYSDISCDFTGHTKEELPQKYQEVQIIQDEKVLMTGYVESYNLGEMREKDIGIDINISLYSPKKMATIRTTSAIGTFNLKDVIEKEILKPLIDDGFILKEINISNYQITVNFMVETIEYCLNNLSNKYNFWWHIDENKNIYIKDINIMLNEKPKYKYDEHNRIPYLIYVKPTISSYNYANVINFKNVRIYEFSNLVMNGNTIDNSYNPLLNKQITVIGKDKQLIFNHPCDISKENILKSGQSIGKKDVLANKYLYGIKINGTYTDGSTFNVYIRYDRTKDVLETSDNVGFDGDEESSNKEFLFVRDSFFKNLITGFKFNNESKSLKTIEVIQSDSALIWNINKMYNDKAIFEKKGIVSDTGIVEVTIDMNESWKTLQELREIGASYINKNEFEFDGEIELKIDTMCDIEIGDIIQINKMLFNDIYVVTEIQINNLNNENEWIIKCKNCNLLDNFVDVFRKENTQENSAKTYKISIVHYTEEEIKEVFEVIK